MIHSPLFDASPTGQSNDCLFYIADWFTTILGFAGNTADLGVDGVDQWEAISSMGATCPREQFRFLIDHIDVFTKYTCQSVWLHKAALRGMNL